MKPNCWMIERSTKHVAHLPHFHIFGFPIFWDKWAGNWLLKERNWYWIFPIGKKHQIPKVVEGSLYRLTRCICKQRHCAGQGDDCDSDHRADGRTVGWDFDMCFEKSSPKNVFFYKSNVID